MPNKPVVPSKDALRALRSLAYSSPATLIGTVGALCGIVTVHYHERQRLQKVQRVLETKRKLQSLSQGRGSARVAVMFEAAERGEDFTIHNGRQRRTSGKRKHSMPSAQLRENRDEESPVHARGGITTIEPNVTEDQDGLGDNCDHSQHLPSSSNTLSQWTPFHLSDSRPSSTMEGRHQIFSKSKLANKPDMEVAWVVAVKEARQNREFAKKEIAKSLLLSQMELQSTPVMPSSADQVIPSDQSVSDLNPIVFEPSVVADAGEEDNTRAKITEVNSIYLDLDVSGSTAGNAFNMLQPWEPNLVDQDWHESKPQADNREGFKSLLSNIYVSSSGQVTTLKVHHPFKSRYNLRNTRVRRGMSVVGADRYEYVYNSLMHFRHQRGDDAALAYLGHIMDRYTITDKRSDFALVQALFLDCTRSFSISQLKPLVHRFVEKFLHRDEPRLEVVSFLYPGCGAGDSSYEQHYYFLAHQYLEFLQHKGYSLDGQVVALRTVLAGTRLCNLPLHEHLFLPALRALCAAGRMTSAQALLDEAASTYKIETSFYSLQELVRGYARAGNWSRIKSVLEECHSKEWSHKKVYGLTGLLTAVVDEHALSHSVQEVVRFVMHCLREYSVQPVSSLTREVVGVCLRKHRYDLVTEWIDMVRMDYPHIDPGTDSSTFAFDVACLWTDMDASCEDILSGCRAISSNRLRDPFSTTLRSTMAEAATRYLEPRLKEVSELIEVDLPEDSLTNPSSLDSFLAHCRDRAPTEIRGARFSLLISHLQAQSQALRNLDMICGGHWQLQPPNQQRFVVANELDINSEAQRAQPLPPYPALENVVMKQYAQRDKSDQPIKHVHLRDVARQLAQQGREVDAFNLIRVVYDSRWVQAPTGREFDLDIFIDWLKLASHLRSGTKLRAVLWAVVEAGPHLDLNGQILLLARIAAPKALLSKTKHARMFEVDEVEYLRMRLKQRRWSVMQSRPQSTIQLQTWDGFGSPPAIPEDFK